MMFFFFFASLAPVAKGFTNGGGISAKALRFADPTALFSVQLETPPAPSKTKIERLKAELELAEEWKKSNDSVRPVPLHVMDGDQEVLSKPLNGMNGATPIEKPTENFFEEEQKENRPVLKFPDPPIISSPSLPGSNGSSQASKADVVKKLKIELDRASNFFEEVQMDYAEMKDDSNQLDEESSAVSDLASAEPVSTSKPKIQTGMQQTIESEPKKEPTLSHTVSSLDKVVDAAARDSVKTKIEKLKQELQLAKKFFEEELAEKTSVSDSIIPVQNDAPPETVESFVTQLPRSSVSTLSVPSAKASVDVPAVSRKTNIERLKKELDLHREFFDTLLKEKEQIVPPKLSLNEESEEKAFSDVVPKSPSLSSRKWETIIPNQASNVEIPLRPSPTATALPDVPQAASLATKIDRIKRELQFAREFFDFETTENKKVTEMLTGEGHVVDTQPDAFEDISSSRPASQTQATSSEGSLESIGTLADSGNAAQTDTLSTVPIKTKIDRLKVELKLAQQFFRELQTQISAKVSTDLRAPIELDDTNIGAKELDNTNFRQEDSGPVEPERQCDTGTAASIRARIDRLKVELELARKFFDELHHESRTKTTLDSSEPMEKGKANVEAEEPDVVIEYKSEVSVPVKPETTTKISNDDAQTDTLSTVPIRTKIDRLKVELKLARQFFGDLQTQSSAKVSTDLRAPIELDDTNIGAKELDNTNFRQEDSGPVEPERQCDTGTAASIRARIDRLKVELEFARKFFDELHHESRTKTSLDPSEPMEKGKANMEAEEPDVVIEYKSEVSVPVKSETTTEISNDDAQTDTLSTVPIRTKIDRLKVELELARQFFGDLQTQSSAKVSTDLRAPIELDDTNIGAKELDNTNFRQEDSGPVEPERQCDTDTAASIRARIDRLKVELEFARKFFDELHDESRTKTSLNPSEPMEKGKANMEAEPDVVIEYKSEVSVPVKSETTTEIINDDAQTDTLSTVPIRTKIDRLKVELELARQFFGELQTQSSAKVSTVLRAPIEPDDNNIGAKGLDNTNFRQEDSGPVEPERHCDTGAAASIRARTDRLKVELELARKFFDELHHESRTKTTLDSSEPMEKGKANVEAEEPDAIIEYKSEVSVPVNSETMTIHASTRTKIDRLKVELHLAQQFFEELHLESSANGAHDRYMPDEVIEAYTDDQEPGFVVEPTGPLSAVSTPAKQISSFAISDISAVSVRTKIDGLKREVELAREFFREQYAQPVSATSMGLDSEKATEKESEDGEMDTMQYEVELVDIPPSNSVESDITSESDDAPSTLLQTKIRRLKGELDLARQFFEESVTASSRTAYRRNQNGKVAYIEADAEVSKSRSSQHILPTCLSTPTEEAQESPLATLESASNALETTEIYQNEKPPAPLGTKISRLKKELQLARKFFDEAIDDSNAVIKSFAEIKVARDILSGKPKPEEGLSPSTKTNHFTPAVANIEGTRDYIIDSPVLKASAEPSSSIKATISEPSSLTNPISSIDDAVDLSIVAPTDAAPTDSQTLEPVVPATDSTIDSVNDADVGEPCSLKEEMELLKAQIERAREWQETGPAITPAPSVVPGYRSVADPLIDLKRSHSPDVARSSFKTEIELLEFQLELAMDWQKVNMAFMPPPPKSEPFSETALSSADEAYESLRTKIELLKDQLEHAKEEWNAKKSKMEPTPWISLIDLADLSNGQTVTSGPHETDDFVDVSFSSDNTDWTTEPASSTEEMDLLREQIDRAKKWRETTLEPAFPIFNGVRPLSDPLNNARKPPTIPDLPTISSPKFPGTK